MWNVSARLSFSFSCLSWKENIIFHHTRSPPYLIWGCWSSCCHTQYLLDSCSELHPDLQSVCAFTGDLQRAGSVSLHPKAAGENQHLAVEHTKWQSTCWHAALEVGHKIKPVNKTQSKIPELKCFLCYFMHLCSGWSLNNIQFKTTEVWGDLCSFALYLKAHKVTLMLWTFHLNVSVKMKGFNYWNNP